MSGSVDKEELSNKIRKSLEEVQLKPREVANKQAIRAMHSTHKSDFVQRNLSFWNKNKHLCGDFLLDGKRLNPENIVPQLIQIEPNDAHSAKVFRLACFNWSIPTSRGFGRRLRFLVWDKHHNALIGLIGLTDPVFNLKVRDEVIGWDANARKERLTCVMDAFTLGAVPPYSHLLGGKLVAALLSSEQIQDCFTLKYQNRAGIISGQKKQPQLAAITTTSVLGRSSVYNRLKLNGQKILSPIGFTSGYGHFQFSDHIFKEMKNLVEAESPEKANSFSFGHGPNWKIRTIREALRILGIDQTVVKHGIRREVFICRLFENSFDHLKAGIMLEGSLTRATEVISNDAMNRWVVPRSQRDKRFQNFKADDWIERIIERQQ